MLKRDRRQVPGYAMGSQVARGKAEGDVGGEDEPIHTRCGRRGAFSTYIIGPKSSEREKTKASKMVVLLKAGSAALLMSTHTMVQRKTKRRGNIGTVG
ncbi:hypothetical protein MLD38_000632 [Melastoma candidum]|uniref:Uncharacterized protein n=1 Tax=Melastoma candidum TaxID=119954 RepID=A0ACB9SAT7_9MYRT|nr:hypothetical protein MLD38_000632 [Melastoma candidum]